MANRGKSKRKQSFYDNYAAGIFGGIVSGISIFTYSYLLGLGWGVIPSAVAFAIVFLVMHFLSKRNIERKFRIVE